MEQIKINTIPSGVPSVCHISQFDNTSRIIRCHLFNDADPLTLTGSETILLFVRKSDNSRAEFEIESTSGTFIDLVITSEMSDIAGDSECKFQITDGEKTIGTLNFKMIVEPDAYGDSLKTRSVSGPIATFETDLAEDLIKLDVDLEPIQDLNGYDNAWGPGSGINKLGTNRTLGTLSGNLPSTPRVFEYDKFYVGLSFNNYYAPNNIQDYNVDEHTVSLKTRFNAYGIAFPIKVAENTSYAINASSYNDSTAKLGIGYFDADGVFINYKYNIGGLDVIITPSGCVTAVVVVYDGAASDETVSVTDIFFNNPSTVTTFTPYSNICPISGHDRVEIKQTGKNLLSPHLYKGVGYNPNVGTVITFSDSSKQFVDNGDGTFSISTNSNWETFDLVFKLIKNATCYRKVLFTTTNMLAVSEVYLNSNLEVIWKNSNTAISQLKNSVITPPEGAVYYVMVFSNRGTTDPTTLTITEPQIEPGSVATDYEPYVDSPEIATIRFGQTIYKGKVMPESDLIEITHVCETYDGSVDEAWGLTSSSSVRKAFRIYLQYNKKPTVKATDEMLSSVIPLRTTSETTSVDNDVITCRSTTYLHKIFYIFTPPYMVSTVEELRAYLSANPETVMYPLDEHIYLKISDLFVSDNEPYLSRQSGGSVEVLDREIDSLVGGTIGWNQISALTRAAGESYGITTEITNGLLTITGTPTQASGQWRLMLDTRFNAIPTGHKLLLCGNTEHFWFRVQGADTTKTTKTQKEIMLEASSTTIADIVIMMANMDTSVAVNESVYLQLFDLTVMFGSVIADYIYALEQATAGAGITWFRERFPKNYYPYNAGQLISVKTSKHITTGKNLISHEGTMLDQTVYSWGSSDSVLVSYLNRLPAGTYRCSFKCRVIQMQPGKTSGNYGIIFRAIRRNGSQFNIQMRELKSNVSVGSVFEFSSTITLTSSEAGLFTNAYYYTGRAYNDGNPDYCEIYDFQIELGSTATDYIPYVGYEYPLDPNLELRGIPKLDSNKMYYDGDTYESSGSVTRKYGIVDLGTMTWTATPITNAGNRFYSNALDGAKRPTVTSVIPNIVCSKYEAKLVSAYSQAVNGITIYTNGSIQVYDVNMSSSTAAQFKTAMSGVYLVYELDTPTTESAASFENPQKVDPNGIEMYEDTRDISLAVGHETKYLLNPETPTIFTALVGTNNVYSDAGDVEVEYYTTLEGGND